MKIGEDIFAKNFAPDLYVAKDYFVTSFLENNSKVFLNAIKIQYSLNSIFFSAVLD